MASKSRLPLCCLFLGLASLGGRAALAQTSEGVPTPSRRVKVSDVVASSLIAKKTALQCPDSARNAGIQGTVVLNAVTSETGDVKEVTVVSGDPSLAQAAADAVKQWKTKPYVVDGSPVEMETQASINFHLKSVEHAAPPLGAFKDDLYSDAVFDVAYPLSRD